MTKFLNTRILLSGATILTASAVIIGATFAFFSDTETSSGNTFAAGGIDLLVDSQAHYAGLTCIEGVWVEDQAEESTRPDLIGLPCSGTWTLTDLGPAHTFFNLGDLKPGDEGENTISLHVENNDAYVCAVVNNLEDNDNGLTEPEEDDGDTTGGDGEGELSAALRFFAWADTGPNDIFDGDDPLEGDNIWQEGEQPLFSNGEGPASDVLGGVSYPLFTPSTNSLPAGDTAYVGLYWCFGEISIGAGTLTCNGELVNNITQTDSMTADLSFYVEQARNNEDFTCPTPDQIEPDNNITVVVEEEDLETASLVTAKTNGSWFFYNDTADSIMTIDQFLGDGGENHMDEVAGVGSAKMVLHEASARYNIATYKYSDIKLADIDELSYRIYDGSASSQTPYLHFNVDFNNSDTWQNRLVMVPSGVASETWATVDAIDGGSAMWTYSGANWPAGLVDGTGSTPGTTPRSWDDILANYPDAETRSTDSFLGVRVGHPGPDGEIGYVDWINFNGEVSNFEN